MKILHFRSRTDHEGAIRIDVGPPDTEVDLVVTLAPEDPEVPKTDAEWLQAVLELEGSIDDPTFKRHPQGEYPQRDPLL